MNYYLIADLTDTSPEEVLICNLYYDAMKVVFGCSAFAMDTDDGPIHARNLDWWTENEMLSRYTLIVNYRRGNSAPLFRVVGWPGFIGALSGIAPGRFCCESSPSRRDGSATASRATREGQILRNAPQVQTEITVQQMVMSAGRGTLEVRLPCKSSC